MTRKSAAKHHEAMSSAQAADIQVRARLGRAALAILRPMARLFLAHGVTFQEAERLLKRAFYAAAHHELARAGTKANMSRISVATGLHRRDVKQLADQFENTDERLPASSSRSQAAEFYMRWLADPRRAENDLRLPMRADDGALSFEAIAREISKDAHPRSLLEELTRLGLVQVDNHTDHVTMRAGGFVPILQRTELLELMGENLSAHIDTAVGNVVDKGSKRLEQAINEEQLSTDSISKIDKLSRDIWRRATGRLVPALVNAREQSDQTDTPKKYSVHIGMYMYTDMPNSGDPETDQEQRKKK